MFDELISGAIGLIWSIPLIALCLLAGVYFTIRTGLLQVRNIPDMLDQLKKGETSPDGTSSFQSLMMSRAGRVRMGNMRGVSAGSALGVPGAGLRVLAPAFPGA